MAPQSWAPKPRDCHFAPSPLLVRPFYPCSHKAYQLAVLQSPTAAPVVSLFSVLFPTNAASPPGLGPRPGTVRPRAVGGRLRPPGNILPRRPEPPPGAREQALLLIRLGLFV